MNESWKQAEADAHEAKAEALHLAIDALLGVMGALEPLAQSQITETVRTLSIAVSKRETAATLARGKVSA